MHVVPGERVIKHMDRREGQLHSITRILVCDKVFVQVQLCTSGEPPP